MKKIKKFALFAIAAASAVGLASCGQPAEATDEFEQNGSKFIPNIEVFIVGSHWNSWTPDYGKISVADPSCKFVLDESSSGLDTRYTYTTTVTQEMVDAWCGFKFVSTNGWDTQWGMEDVDFTKSNSAFVTTLVGDKNEDGKVDAEDKYFYHEGTSNRNNIVVTAPGTLTISYYPYNFTSETKNDVPYSCKFSVDFTAA